MPNPAPLQSSIPDPGQDATLASSSVASPMETASTLLYFIFTSQKQKKGSHALFISSEEDAEI
jgi:hypothetical protein